MIIHKDNLIWDAALDLWQLYILNVGMDNEAYLHFSCKANEIPETGDMVVNNKLVKAKDGKD